MGEGDLCPLARWGCDDVYPHLHGKNDPMILRRDRDELAAALEALLTRTVGSFTVAVDLLARVKKDV